MLRQHRLTDGAGGRRGERGRGHHEEGGGGEGRGGREGGALPGDGDCVGLRRRTAQQRWRARPRGGGRQQRRGGARAQDLVHVDDELVGAAEVELQLERQRVQKRLGHRPSRRRRARRNVQVPQHLQQRLRRLVPQPLVLQQLHEVQWFARRHSKK